MPIEAPYVFIASMDVDADKEAIFNEVYDTEHIPYLLRVPGVRSARRMKGEPFAVTIGGSTNAVTHKGPVYSAIFELDSPDVLLSPQWVSAVEAGRWPKEVRPYTRNRQHAVFRVR